MFRWKLLPYIITNKKNLLKFKIVTNSTCNVHVCNVEEDYKHYFIDCLFLKKVSGKKTKHLLQKSGFENDVCLEHCVMIQNLRQ